jgi:hypothetical protein
MDSRSTVSGTKRTAESNPPSELDSASSDLELSSHDEDEFHEVERILAQQEVEGEPFYLVKWLNYVRSLSPRRPPTSVSWSAFDSKLLTSTSLRG